MPGPDVVSDFVTQAVPTRILTFSFDGALIAAAVDGSDTGMRILPAYAAPGFSDLLHVDAPENRLRVAEAILLLVQQRRPVDVLVAV
jgi:hypothetical protein